ncbi:polysaccharide deacetylase family protein [Pseudomonas aeruginosa]|uniref:polysaccharide deacetylase family protein n=1 Tax=Pseudomonas aeruginosa TaxID=287 RepID=UPI001244E49F|nr:polysaccharide deacetylase [Pseudomonas aeruginosa]KAB0694631.1 polysaccharide deacetylase [Pseudomonas aeruginosa]
MSAVLTAAEPIVWPEGKRCAAAFTFDVDAETPLLAHDPKLAERMGLMSHQAYGPLVGVPAILKAMREVGVRGSFFVPGYTALRYPEQIKQIVVDGHEIGHHGHLHEPLAGVSEAQEREFLMRGLDALDKICGVTPKGYRAPIWELNWRTPGIVEEAGFLYDSSLMDADVPYELDVGNGRSLVELPINWILDDWQQYAYIPNFSGCGVIETPAKAIELFRSEFDEMRDNGGLWVLTCHPFLSGRPGRVAALKGLMQYAKSFDDVWIAPLDEIAAYVREQRLTPRSLNQPDPSL